MPNRVLRDWTDSEKMSQITSQAERFFTRLIMKADDFGCFHANPKLLKAALFPLSDDIKDLDVAKWLNECAKVELVVVYKVDSKMFLQIVDFGQRLRQSKPKFPQAHEAEIDVNKNDSNSPRLPATSRDFPPESETETETETRIGRGKSLPRFDPTDYFKSGEEAFEEIKADEIYVERLLRVVHGAGYRSCGAVEVIKAVKGFITKESAKEEFSLKPKREVKSHLVNWISKNAKSIHEYAN